MQLGEEDVQMKKKLQRPQCGLLPPSPGNSYSNGPAITLGIKQDVQRQRKRMIACNQLSVNLAMSCPVRGKQVLFNPPIHTNLDMPSLTALVPHCPRPPRRPRRPSLLFSSFVSVRQVDPPRCRLLQGSGRHWARCLGAAVLSGNFRGAN